MSAATPSEKTAALKVACRAASRALWEEVQGSPPSVRHAVGNFFIASARLADFWQNRTRTLTRQLRSALACDALDDIQRTAILRGLYGPTGCGWNPHVYTDAERAILAHYRTMDPAARSMVRTLVARIATSSTTAATRADGHQTEKGGDDGKRVDV